MAAALVEVKLRVCADVRLLRAPVITRGYMGENWWHFLSRIGLDFTGFLDRDIYVESQDKDKALEPLGEGQQLTVSLTNTIKDLVEKLHPLEEYGVIVKIDDYTEHPRPEPMQVVYGEAGDLPPQQPSRERLNRRDQPRRRSGVHHRESRRDRAASRPRTRGLNSGNPDGEQEHGESAEEEAERKKWREAFLRTFNDDHDFAQFVAKLSTCVKPVEVIDAPEE